MEQRYCGNKECTQSNPQPLDNFYFQYRKNSKGEEYKYYKSECKSCTKKRSTKWIKENKDRYKEIKYKTEQKESSKLLTRNRIQKFRDSGKYNEWLNNNKDKLKNYAYARIANKTHTITKDEWCSCKGYFDNSCAYCGLHESEHFKMFRGKLRKHDLHKEHVIHNGSNDLSNCVPSCGSCNSQKWTYSMEEWYSEDNKSYTENRYNKIIKWLSEDYKKYIRQ